MKPAPGSFRDPSGYVYEQDDKIIRTIARQYQPHWEKAAPFLKTMVKEGLVLPFQEVEPLDGAWKSIQAQRLPFVSYPYEWSHSQLKAAALLTLRLQKRALKRGLVLKDASAYNIQFIGARPVFIDHLSFEVWQEGAPWGAYKQFCTHFLAPLALLSSVDLRCGTFSRLWIDGIPLDLAAALLPKHKRLNPGLNFHLFTHARMQGKYADSQVAGKTTSIKITPEYLGGLADSLERLINSRALQLTQGQTEWSDYYQNTNYSIKAADSKLAIVAQQAEKHGKKALALDLGANNGRYTAAISPHFDYTIGADIDPLAVNQHYRQRRELPEAADILPLVIDLANPSPGIGFSNTERPAFRARCRADFAIALALIHHLRITAGIPLPLLAEFLSSLLTENGVLLLEFVPKEDTQVQKLLAQREDIFTDYTLEGCQEAFAACFRCTEVLPVSDSCRSILLLHKRER